ncbi:MAG: DUF2829 domain-containing protein [Pseudomonadota bacterium]
MKTFQDYLAAQPVIDHALRAVPTLGGMRFYVHPSGVDGDTVDFAVIGNTLLPLQEPALARLDFGQAIALLKSGKRVARAGWNGKGMWLSMVADWTGNILPESESFKMLPFIAMRTAQADLVPWLASQTDMLADDWTIA